MRKIMAITSIRMVLAFWFIVLLVGGGNIRAAKGEGTLTVEGEWELISTNADAVQKDIGKRLSILRKGNDYEVKWSDGSGPDIYTGNETRIVHTFLQEVGAGLGPIKENDPTIPPSVLQQVAGQKAPINVSFTVSGDGSFLQETCDALWYYWESGTGRFDHYEIKPAYISITFERISGPASNTARLSEPALDKKTETSAVAQVESRGEFYFLTKDGRKLTGNEANQVPLEEGTKVVTGSSGHVRMKLPDDTTFTVGPNSDLVIDKFVYDADKNPKTIIANLSKGVFRWVTGKVARQDPDEMKVKVPVGHLGIRGTDFEVTVESDGSGFVMLYFGQLEITEKNTGFKFILDAGQKVTFDADGSFSRPMIAD